MLFSTETGELLAILPDGVMQRLRVGAANGLAARHLASAGASRVALTVSPPGAPPSSALAQPPPLMQNASSTFLGGVMTRVDLNCDMGESFGAWSMGHDAEVMASITSANIACGFHGGDPEVMRRTVRLARQHGVAIGPHPSLPDLVGFGRREMKVSPGELEDMMLYQIGALAAMAAAEGVSMQHVKAHGALYNMTAHDTELANSIARAVAAFDRTLILLGLPGSALIRAGEAAGLRTAAEAFADRAYEPDGSLMSRRKPGAVIHDADTVVARAVRMVREGGVQAADGSWVPMTVDTICTHGDTPGSHELVRRLRQALEADGIVVAPLGAVR